MLCLCHPSHLKRAYQKPSLNMAPADLLQAVAAASVDQPGEAAVDEGEVAAAGEEEGGSAGLSKAQKKRAKKKAAKVAADTADGVPEGDVEGASAGRLPEGGAGEVEGDEEVGEEEDAAGGGVLACGNVSTVLLRVREGGGSRGEALAGCGRRIAAHAAANVFACSCMRHAAPAPAYSH